MDILAIKKIKANLDDKLTEAKGSLILNDGIQPLFIYSDGTIIKEIRLTMEESNKEKESKEMVRICSDPKILCAAILMDVNAITVRSDEEDSVKNLKNFSEHPNCADALYTVLYTKDKSFIKSVPYFRKGERNYMFGCGGWQDADSTGHFHNPFLK
jgi:hypothetical protein